MRKLSEDKKINRSDLAKEWEELPGLFEYWGNQWVMAHNDKLNASIHLSFVEAQLYATIKNNPKEYNIPKVTDKAIQAEVIKQKAYIDANKTLSDCINVLNQMTIAKTTIEYKKESLKHITKLEMSGFYESNTGPSQSLVNEVNSQKEAFKNRKR